MNTIKGKLKFQSQNGDWWVHLGEYGEKRTFSASTMEELESIWQNELMNKGWDIKKPLNVRWSWFKFDYEYFFVAEYVA